MELWAFILLGLGLVFIVLEVFFPSFGILGTIAAGCIIAGGVLAFRASGIFAIYLVLAFVLVPVSTLLGLKLLPHTPIGKKLMLAGSTFDPAEATAGSGAQLDQFMGQVGVAQTPLRPSGKAVFDGRRLDVLTRGEMVEAGRSVKVVRVEGNRVIVAEERS